MRGHKLGAAGEAQPAPGWRVARWRGATGRLPGREVNTTARTAAPAEPHGAPPSGVRVCAHVCARARTGLPPVMRGVSLEELLAYAVQL